jgi:hypothetical protein
LKLSHNYIRFNESRAGYGVARAESAPQECRAKIAALNKSDRPPLGHFVDVHMPVRAGDFCKGSRFSLLFPTTDTLSRVSGWIAIYEFGAVLTKPDPVFRGATLFRR